MRAWNVLGINPQHDGARLNFLGFTSHYYLSCQDEEKPKCLLWLLHSRITSNDLLWFLGSKLFLLAWVTLAGHVGHSRVLNLWAECQGWDTQGKFSAMSGPKLQMQYNVMVRTSYTYHTQQNLLSCAREERLSMK